MKLSDYIVQFFVERAITDFFGYQGTMIAHLVDSIGKNAVARNHACYNEQGAAFAVCGYACTSGKCGVAYATSGPGALNLVSGIANAYYDSIPVVFITGQVNTYEYTDLPNLRQAGFQETKTVDICRPITKYAVQISDASRVRFELEKAYYLATTGRPGPTLLDIPMNIQRTEVDPENLVGYEPEPQIAYETDNILKGLQVALQTAKRPVLLLGKGVQKTDWGIFRKFAEHLQLPVITSLRAKGFLPYTHPLNYGYMGGAYGNRYANMIVSGKSDLIIAVGYALCTRQTGTNVKKFAPNAKLIRFDVDPEELKRKIKSDEQGFVIDTRALAELLRHEEVNWKKWESCNTGWLKFCAEYKKFAEEFDCSHPMRYPNRVVGAFNQWIGDSDIIVSDVGQHMMWVGQSIHEKGNQDFLFSGGHGAMGYALPAAIGASIAAGARTTYCFCGDGAIQMNIQELQWLKNENRDVVVVVFNNHALGMITQLQDAYFNGAHFGTMTPDFSVPSFVKIAQAYGIDAACTSDCDEIEIILRRRQKGKPFLLEFVFEDLTVAVPKTVLGEAIYNQEPLLPQEKLNEYLTDICMES